MNKFIIAKLGKDTAGQTRCVHDVENDGRSATARFRHTAIHCH